MAATTAAHALRNTISAVRRPQHTSKFSSASCPFICDVGSNCLRSAALSEAGKQNGKQSKWLPMLATDARHSSAESFSEEDLISVWEKLLRDGYAVLPRDSVITAPARNCKEGSVVFKFLLPLDGQVPNPEILGALDVTAASDATWSDTIVECSPGFGCLDGKHCPDPSWVQDNWKLCYQVSPSVDMSPETANLTIIRVLPQNRGEGSSAAQVALYKGSHWVAADWLDLRSSDTTGIHLPRVPRPPCLPLPEHTTVSLSPGDIIVCHPYLAFSLLPNPVPLPSSSPHTPPPSHSLSISTLYSPTHPASTPSPPPATRAAGMWAGWPADVAERGASLASCRSSPWVGVREGGSVSFQELEEEEEKAGKGNWAVRELEGGLRGSHVAAVLAFNGVTEGKGAEECDWPEFPHADARDVAVWRLTLQARALLSEHRFADALPLLRKAVGFRPRDAWLFYQAGRCSERSAPAGQLAGRAGRKCLLEDGERYLSRAIDLAPLWPLPYVSLILSLYAMGRGRELEAPQVTEKMTSIPSVKETCSGDASVLEEAREAQTLLSSSQQDANVLA